MAAGQEAEQKPWEAALPVNAQSLLSILALSPVATEGTVLSCASQDSGSLPIMQATLLLASKTGPQKTAGLVTATTSTGEVGAPEAAPSPRRHPLFTQPPQMPCSFPAAASAVCTWTRASHSPWNALPAHSASCALTPSRKPLMGPSASLPPLLPLTTSPSPHLGSTWCLIGTQ